MLKRRDFTVNGMFYDPVDGRIYDYVGGQEDVQRGVIRGDWRSPPPIRGGPFADAAGDSIRRPAGV